MTQRAGYITPEHNTGQKRQPRDLRNCLIFKVIRSGLEHETYCLEVFGAYAIHAFKAVFRITPHAKSCIYITPQHNTKNHYHHNW